MLLNMKGMGRSNKLPPAFFLSKRGVALSTQRQSNAILVTSAGAVTITGGDFSINGGAFGTTGTCAEGDTIRVRTTSSDAYLTSVEAVLSIAGTEYDTFSLTTMAEPVAVPSGERMLNPDGTQAYNPDGSIAYNPGA